MRRFCRNVDIKDIKFIQHCIYLWLEEKKGRRDVQRFLAKYVGVPEPVIREACLCEDYRFVPCAVEHIAKDIQGRIAARKPDLPEIHFKWKYDEICEKWRLIGIQHPLHQIFDYIAVEGCRELFSAKIGQYQMASLPGRGQEEGVKIISRWIQTDEAHTRCYVQADVKQCYPSVDHGLLVALFTRDLKNPELLWMVCQLIDMFPGGLSIGSYFSQYACNYYLSKAYHYATEQLFKERKKHNGRTERIRLAYHVMFYMDDILLLGSSQKDVRTGIEMLSHFMLTEMGLTIKPDWKSGKVDYIGKDGKRHGAFIDMMGYRIYRDHITIRRKTFRRIRRTIIRVENKLERGEDIHLDTARRIVAYAGRLEHSDSFQFVSKHNVLKIKNRSKNIISAHDKVMVEEKKRRKQEYGNRNSTLSYGAGSNPVQQIEGRVGGGVDQKEHYTEDSPF